MTRRINTLFFGIVLGAILPMASFYAFYSIRVKPMGINYDTYLLMLHTETPVLYNPIVFVMLLVNAFLFGVFMNFKLYRIGFGIFYITAIYGVIALLLKWYFFGYIF